MINSISIILLHFGVDKEAGVAKLGNLSCKQFNSFCAIAENYGLRNVEFGEKSVKAMELFFLF
jgi:hypothetical protein